ncbi:hypothetical protein HAX54_044668, partial [Datura stramonium]|nr:hypothetical protein [Datura stramonium]
MKRRLIFLTIKWGIFELTPKCLTKAPDCIAMEIKVGRNNYRDNNYDGSSSGGEQGNWRNKDDIGHDRGSTYESSKGREPSTSDSRDAKIEAILNQVLTKL